MDLKKAIGDSEDYFWFKIDAGKLDFLKSKLSCIDTKLKEKYVIEPYK